MARVVVLGSGTGVPTGRRSSPGFVVETGGDDEGVLLIDPGPGALGRMAKAGIPVERVDRVLLTHLHVDHTLDIAALLFARHNPDVAASAPPLTVTGPAGTAALISGMTNLYGRSLETGPESLKVLEATPGRLDPETGLEGSAWPMEHTPHAQGYRLKIDGKVFALSGDTGPCENLVHLGSDADLFFIECSLPDGQKVKGHLTPGLIAPVAKKANPKRLVLYHLYPPVDENEALQTIRQGFDGSVEIAEDHAEYLL